MADQLLGDNDKADKKPFGSLETVVAGWLMARC